MESIFFDVLKKALSEQLAPVLLGALGAIVYLNFQWKVPDRLREFRARLIRVEKRQKVIVSMLEQSLSASGNKIDVERLERMFNSNEDEDNI